MALISQVLDTPSSEQQLSRPSCSSHPIQHNPGHFGGGLLDIWTFFDWYWQTTVQDLDTITQQNNSTLVQPPLTTLGQETRYKWAHTATH